MADEKDNAVLAVVAVVSSPTQREETPRCATSAEKRELIRAYGSDAEWNAALGYSLDAVKQAYGGLNTAEAQRFVAEVQDIKKSFAPHLLVPDCVEEGGRRVISNSPLVPTPVEMVLQNSENAFSGLAIFMGGAVVKSIEEQRKELELIRLRNASGSQEISPACFLVPEAGHADHTMAGPGCVKAGNGRGRN